MLSEDEILDDVAISAIEKTPADLNSPGVRRYREPAWGTKLARAENALRIVTGSPECTDAPELADAAGEATAQIAAERERYLAR